MERGRQLYEPLACATCHTTDGSPLVGPTHRGLYLATERLEDGSTVFVDAAYLYRSIRDPQAQITAGYPGIIMPGLPAGITDQQVWDLVEFIKSLR